MFLELLRFELDMLSCAGWGVVICRGKQRMAACLLGRGVLWGVCLVSIPPASYVRCLRAIMPLTMGFFTDRAAIVDE